MKRCFLYPLLALLLCSLCSWGFFGHIRINRLAVFTLPPAILPFYKSNISYISLHAVDPDKRRYADTAEAARHYLDVENYEAHIDSIPRKYEDALKKYGYKMLNENGVLPWHIQRSYLRLVNAFKQRDSIRILTASTQLGHYIADAHVPLHTTRNHNGQLTNQHGIHAFWESRLPELFATGYQVKPRRASYIEDPLKTAWQMVSHSHALVDSVLHLEAALSRRYPRSQQQGFSRRSNSLLKQYAAGYAKAYHDAMNHMVERQMQQSILLIGSYWYSAWVDAGQPDLRQLKKQPASQDEVKIEQAKEQKFRQGQIIGREI